MVRHSVNNYGTSWLVMLSRRIKEFNRLRRSGLGIRSAFRCAAHCNLKYGEGDE